MRALHAQKFQQVFAERVWIRYDFSHAGT
jgi:hypothetical protein